MKIADENRLTEDEVIRKAEQVWPEALGAVLDLIVAIIRELPTTRPAELPRMADCARWVTAAEKALGWESGSFIKAIRENRQQAVEICLDASPLVQVIAEVTKNAPFHGTATELLASMSTWAVEHSFKTKLPKDASTLGTQIRRLAPALEGAGYTIEFGTGSKRWINIVNPKQTAGKKDSPSKTRTALG
jgi:hypothetical protein